MKGPIEQTFSFLRRVPPREGEERREPLPREEERRRNPRRSMLSMVSRQGRQLQRYTSSGNRLVVGCIPYKLKKIDSPFDGEIGHVVEVLVISSQKREEVMFPKGGWELDETIIQAASREAFEEAGVQGNVEASLGQWRYKSKTQDAVHQGIMFPLLVTEELYHWPEKDVRKRKWISAAEALMECKHQWMREALGTLVARLSSTDLQEMPIAPDGIIVA